MSVRMILTKSKQTMTQKKNADLKKNDSFFMSSKKKRCITDLQHRNILFHFWSSLYVYEIETSSSDKHAQYQYLFSKVTLSFYISNRKYGLS